MRLLLVLAVFFIAGCSFSPDTTSPSTNNKSGLIKDSQVTHGVLDNGLHYYIRPNGYPEKRVQLQLAVHVGGLSDPENKKGLAHFVEHMAFNGTKHFPKQQVITRMEEMGMRFGSHTNAYTNFHQTVYKLTAPTDKSQDVSDALLILRDWAGDISFEAEEVNNEIGVVVEEWRSRMLGKHARLGLKSFEVTHQGSRYLEQLPIGKPEHIKSFNQQDVVNFYNKWYQPQNMALIVVGDISAAELEKEIVGLFSDLQKGNSVPVELPPTLHEPDLFVHQLSDQETVSSYLQQLFISQQTTVTDTTRHFKHFVLNNLLSDIVNRRLKQVADGENSSYAQAYVTKSSFSDNRHVRNLVVVPFEGEFEKAYTAAFAEVVRLQNLGINQDELDWARKKLADSLELQLTRIEKTSHQYYLGKLLNSYFMGMEQYERKDNIAFAQKALNEVTKPQLEDYIKEEFSYLRQLIINVVPENFAKTKPNKNLISQWQDNATKLAAQSFNSEMISDVPYPYATVGGQLIDERYIDSLDAWLWKLNNGISVYFKPSDLTKDFVELQAISVGGHSLAAPQQRKALQIFSGLKNANGLPGLTPSQTSDYLRAEKINLSTFVSNYKHGYKANSQSSNIEKMLQLSNISMLQPQFEHHVLDKFKTRSIDYLKKKYQQPQAKFFEDFSSFYYQQHYSTKPVTVEDVALLNNKQQLDFHKMLFSNPAEFTYFLYGDISKEQAKELVVKYLGSLKTTQADAKWRDNQKRKVTGKHKFERSILNEQKAHVKVNLFKPTEQSNKQIDTQMYFLGKIGEQILREEIREKLAATYGVSMYAGTSKKPINEQQISISFSTAPDLVDSAVNKIDEVLEKMANGDFNDALLTNQKEAWFKSQESWLQRLGWWQMRLINYGMGEEPENFIEMRHKWVEELSKKDIQTLMQAILNGNNKVTSIMLPKV